MSFFKSGPGHRSFYQNISGSGVVAATDTGNVTLVTGRNANSTIYVQRIIVWINTDAAQSLTFQDSANTPKVIAKVTTSPGAATRWDFDFGDTGVPLTEGKDFVMAISGAGLAGHYEWLGYTKITSAVAAGSTN